METDTPSTAAEGRAGKLTTVRGIVSYHDFAEPSQMPVHLRIKAAFETQGIRFQRPRNPFDLTEQPEPLAPYKMTKACDGRWLEILQDQADPDLIEPVGL